MTPKILSRASLLLSLLFFVLISKSYSSDKLLLNVEGQWLPGAMLQGKVPAGATVKIHEKNVFVDSDGSFVFGLGRDAKGAFLISVTGPSGSEKTFNFSVDKREYKIQRIEGVAKKYVSPPEEVLGRIRADNKQVASARKTFSKERFFKEGFISPAEGPITGVYGSQRVFNGVPKRPHFGLDIAGPVGEKVVAPAGGVVTLVNNDMYYSGGTLIVDHGQGISSTFIHLSKIVVAEGQRVSKGEKIAEIGATGRVTGAHLDWRVNWFEHRLDPGLLIDRPAVPSSAPQS